MLVGIINPGFTCTAWLQSPECTEHRQVVADKGYQARRGRGLATPPLSYEELGGL